jgi:hypothetical protein
MSNLSHGVREWKLAQHLREQAHTGHYTGFGTPEDFSYLKRCGAIHPATGSKLIFTRDQGMHACGWWKNPDYERCWHLSLSFVDPETREHAPHDHKLAMRWCDHFFTHNRRLLWIEPPFSDVGKERNVWHYRLFVAPDWRLAILPRGEVYTREFTEAGWKSWSDIHNEKQESAHE